MHANRDHPFKKGQYDQAVKVYERGQRRDRRLVEQAAELNKKVLQAAHRSENWAARTLHDLQPEFVDRVERYVRGYNQRVQIAELEAKQNCSENGGSRDLRESDEFQDPMSHVNTPEPGRRRTGQTATSPRVKDHPR